MLLNSTLDLFPVSERALVSLVRANVICCSGSDSILDSCYNPGLKRGLFSDSINTQLEGAPSHWLGARYTSAACPASVGVHLCLKGTRSHCVFPGYEGLSLWKMWGKKWNIMSFLHWPPSPSSLPSSPGRISQDYPVPSAMPEKYLWEDENFPGEWLPV